MPAAGPETGQLFDRHSTRIEEIINKNVEMFLPGLDPIWSETIAGTGRMRSDGLGRDLKIIKIYTGATGGVFEPAKSRDDFVLYGAQTKAISNRGHFKQLDQTWPDPTRGPDATHYRLAIPMRAFVSNLLMTMGEMTAEATPSFIGEIIAPKMMGFAKKIGQTLCNAFYVNENDNYSLCTVTNIAISNDQGTNDKITFQPGNQACERFQYGDVIDFWDSSHTARKNDTEASFVNQGPETQNVVMVTDVDPLTNTVTCHTRSDRGTSTSFFTTAPVNGDYVTPSNHAWNNAGSPAFSFIAGINSWLKSGSGSNNNYLLGADRDTTDFIDVTVHSRFKSMTKAVNGSLTEHKLRQYLRRFHAAKGMYGDTITDLIASEGVWLNYEAQKIGREFIDRTGRASSLENEGSTGGFKFVYDGRTYRGRTSQYIETGTVYGLKLANNWEKYVPPSPSGTETFSKLQSGLPFKFVSKILSGGAANALPIFKSFSGATGSINLPTEGLQMPGMMKMQLVPRQVTGMKLTGVSEDRVYSDN